MKKKFLFLCTLWVFFLRECIYTKIYTVVARVETDISERESRRFKFEYDIELTMSCIEIERLRKCSRRFLILFRTHKKTKNAATAARQIVTVMKAIASPLIAPTLGALGVGVVGSPVVSGTVGADGAIVIGLV